MTETVGEESALRDAKTFASDSSVHIIFSYVFPFRFLFEGETATVLLGTTEV